MDTLYRVIGITGNTETIIGEEETYADAVELLEHHEDDYDWVGIIEIVNPEYE